jgi:addiction module RelB/DinJ family antitoxin
MQKEQANYRIDADAKEQAYAVLGKIGIKPTDAVNMLMHHIAMFKELPFKPSIPNAETLQTFADTDAGIGLTAYGDVEEMLSDLDI